MSPLRAQLKCRESRPHQILSVLGNLFLFVAFIVTAPRSKPEDHEGATMLSLIAMIPLLLLSLWVELFRKDRLNDCLDLISDKKKRRSKPIAINAVIILVAAILAILAAAIRFTTSVPSTILDDGSYVAKDNVFGAFSNACVFAFFFSILSKCLENSYKIATDPDYGRLTFKFGFHSKIFPLLDFLHAIRYVVYALIFFGYFAIFLPTNQSYTFAISLIIALALALGYIIPDFIFMKKNFDAYVDNQKKRYHSYGKICTLYESGDSSEITSFNNFLKKEKQDKVALGVLQYIRQLESDLCHQTFPEFKKLKTKFDFGDPEFDFWKIKESFFVSSSVESDGGKNGNKILTLDFYLPHMDYRRFSKKKKADEGFENIKKAIRDYISNDIQGKTMIFYINEQYKLNLVTKVRTDFHKD